MATTIAFLVLLFVFPAVYAANYTVGDKNGWTTNINYTTWASSLNFVVGDTLVFNYGALHSVDEVSEANYGSCTPGTPLSNSSPTIINLNATGARYYICPTTGHCNLGQKLAINVAAGGTAPPPTGNAPPPDGGSVPSTPADTPPSAASSPGTPQSTAGPPPPSAACTLAGNQLVLSLVLVAMVGVLMG